MIGKLTENKNLKDLLANILMAILLIIICFPAYDPQFDKGIDESLVWAYNHLFANDFSKTSALLFPHGPLAFVMYPLPVGNNLIFAAIFDALLKCLIFYCFQSYSNSRDSNAKLNTFVICLLLFHLLNVQMLIIAAVLSLLMLYFDNAKKLYAFIALVLSALALYIKSYVGIIGGLIAVSFILADFIRLRSIKSALLFGIVLTLSYPIIWFLMFGSFANFFTYIYGVKELASDNSAAAAFYPDNNWIYLSLAVASFVAIPIFNRSKKALFFYAITALAVFAAWKHGMARQDIYHTRGLFFFLLLFFTLLNFFNDQYKRSTLLLSFGSLIFFSLNLPNVRLFEENSLIFFRANRFSEFIFDHKNFKNHHLQSSYKNIEEQKLDSMLLKLIGNKTIDVYPWDYSYIAANKLNWQPRPVLHSYAAYSTWLDMKDSQHFSSDNAPEFILLEIDKKTDDIYGGTFESVDNRYLPNDEPQTFISILENYESVHKNNRFILLKKRKLAIKLLVDSASKFNSRFGSVIDLPARPENSVLRIKAKIKKSTKGLFQSFLFKDQESFINYYMDNGDVYRYKIVPKNAADGIWINPFLMHPEMDEKEASCIKISFESSDPSFYQNEITCEWVVYKASTTEDNYIFNKKKLDTKTKLFEQMISDKQFRIEAAGFSKSFQISVDSLFQLSSGKTIETKSNLWSGASKDAVLVISVDDDNKKNLFWEAFELQKFTIKKGLNPVNINKGFDNLEQFNGKKAVLSVYIWNKGNTALEAANFGISFWKK